MRAVAVVAGLVAALTFAPLAIPGQASGVLAQEGNEATCSGPSPQTVECTDSFVLSSSGLDTTVWPGMDFVGGIDARIYSDTGEVTWRCAAVAGLSTCQPDSTGTFSAGQLVTLEVLAPGVGFWEVRAYGT